MALVKVSGIVSNFQQENEVIRAVTQGGMNGGGTTSFQQKKVLNFRIGNKPVTMELGKTIDLSDGDNATVAGAESSGIIKAVAVRNDVTGISYFRYSPMTLFIWAGILILLGLPLMASFIGFLMVPFGIYLGYKGLQTKKALALINETAPVQDEAAT